VAQGVGPVPTNKQTNKNTLIWGENVQFLKKFIDH
jgi:hypothetical protein